MGRYKHHSEGDNEEEDMIPSEESEMVAVLHEIMEDGINYYSDMSLGGTHGQRQYFKGMINALNITLKEITQLGPARGLMRIKKVHRKQVHDRIKHRKTGNLPFDAGLIDGFDEASHRIIEMTYPLYVGAGYSKRFQKEMMAESFEAECDECNTPFLKDGINSNLTQFMYFEKGMSWPCLCNECFLKDYKQCSRASESPDMPSLKELIKLRLDTEEFGAESNAYSAEWGAESNKMKAAILRGIQAAIQEEYATFESKADIAGTVNMILRELGQLKGDEKIEMIDVEAGPAIRIDPYDVVAAMAKAANQMDDLNKEDMVCWDLSDRFLNSATKRLGWGLQSVFGIHALSAKVDGKPSWRVAGYPQAIETWFMLYNSLRINLENEMKGIKKAKAEQFYQAFTMHIRENDNVAKMIEGNADNKEKASELSKDCFPAPEVTKFIPVEVKIEERAKRASRRLEPFSAEVNISELDYVKYAKRNPDVANRLDTDDMRVFFLGVAASTLSIFLGKVWSHKYIKQMDSSIKKD